MNALAYEETKDRRSRGAGRVIGLGQACATGEGVANSAANATTKNSTTKQNEDDALPANAGGACFVGGGRWSDEPMARPDHKAKRHGRPSRQKHKRRNGRTDWDQLLAVPAGLSAGMVTLAMAWPLRFDESIWVALSAL